MRTVVQFPDPTLHEQTSICIGLICLNAPNKVKAKLVRDFVKFLRQNYLQIIML